MSGPTGNPTCDAIIKIYSDTMASVGLIVGAALPIIAANIMLPIYRLCINRSNIRAWFLLVGGLSQVVAATAIVYSFYRPRTSGLVNVGYFCWALAVIMLCAAGIVRFSIPFGVRARERKIFIWASSIVVVIFGIGMLVSGHYEISTWQLPPPPGKTYVYSMRHAGITLVLPTFYAFTGFVTFSYQLRRALRNSGSFLGGRTEGETRMRALEISNYILGGFLLFAVFLYFALFKMFKSPAHAKYDTPTSLIFVTVFFTCENVFEAFTNAVHDTAVKMGSSHGGSRGGASQSQRSEVVAAPTATVGSKINSARRSTMVGSGVASNV